jgi:hypothetical protein
MPFIYRNVIHLEQKPKVDGGECARLVQHYLAHIGQTSTWRPGENVIDVLASGRQIEPGTAIGTFVKGRYPSGGHRHAAFFLSANISCTNAPKTNRCNILSIRMMDQWNPHPGAHYHKDRISSRDVRIYGKSAAYPISDNASMFYIIER